MVWIIFFRIVDHPIKLMIESSAVTDLELVDLPGLTRNPIGEYLAILYLIYRIPVNLVHRYLCTRIDTVLATT